TILTIASVAAVISGFGLSFKAFTSSVDSGSARRRIPSNGCPTTARLTSPRTRASDHQVAHHLAGDAGGRGQPGHDLAIAGIDSKQHTHDLAITTGELEVIGAPADVRAQCNHDAVMRAPWPAAGMPF